MRICQMDNSLLILFFSLAIASRSEHDVFGGDFKQINKKTSRKTERERENVEKNYAARKVCHYFCANLV